MTKKKAFLFMIFGAIIFIVIQNIISEPVYAIEESIINLIHTV